MLQTAVTTVAKEEERLAYIGQLVSNIITSKEEFKITLNYIEGIISDTFDDDRNAFDVAVITMASVFITNDIRYLCRFTKRPRWLVAQTVYNLRESGILRRSKGRTRQTCDIAAIRWDRNDLDFILDVTVAMGHTTRRDSNESGEYEYSITEDGSRFVKMLG